MSAVLATTKRLTTVLQQTAAALTTANAVALLATESGLAELVDELRFVTTIDADSRAAIATELQRARVELHRCRSLGAHATDLVDDLLAMHGHHEYDNLGVATTSTAPAASRVKATL